MLDSLISFLGSKAFSSLANTGLGIYSAVKSNNALDFQKKMALDNKKKNDLLFDQQQQDRAAVHNIDF